MNVADHIEVAPNTRDSIMLAYSYGLISYSTMQVKLLALDEAA